MSANHVLPLYETFPLSEGFPHVDNDIASLLKAAGRRDDNEWWEFYIQLSFSGGLQRLSHTNFSILLRSLHPRHFFSNTGSRNQQEFFRRVLQVQAIFRREVFQ